MSVASRFDRVLADLTTSAERGVSYIQDDLSVVSRDPVAFVTHTHLANPRDCGRNSRGWMVRGGVSDAYTWVTVRDRPVLGNRSLLAQFSFVSTQVGVPSGEHGLVEMRLCRGMTPDDLPLRIRVENGRMYILALNGDMVIAGDREKPVYSPEFGVVYTLTVLLVQKAVLVRLTGAGLPNGVLEMEIPDRRRFIPGCPGFGLQPSPKATAGELVITDWRVTPLGPKNCRLGVIGDSITAGIDMEPEAESYVHLATQALGQEYVLNTGSGGSNTTLDLARFPYEITPFQPDIVWIEGGTNDIGLGGSAEGAFQNMLREASLIQWGGKAVFSTVPPRTLPSAAHYAELTRLNLFIAASGFPFVDRHALVVDHTDSHQIRTEFRHGDGIHITREGHALIAEAATELFKTL